MFSKYLKEQSVAAAGGVVDEGGGGRGVHGRDDGADGRQVAGHARVLQGAQRRQPRLLLLVRRRLQDLKRVRFPFKIYMSKTPLHNFDTLIIKYYNIIRGAIQ